MTCRSSNARQRLASHSKRESRKIGIDSSHFLIMTMYLGIIIMPNMQSERLRACVMHDYEHPEGNKGILRPVDVATNFAMPG